MVAFTERTDWTDGRGPDETIVYAADIRRWEAGIAGLYRTRVAQQSIMALGDSLSASVAAHAGGFDSHLGPTTGHSGADWLFQANLLLDSPFDVLGSAATAGHTVEQIRDQHLPTVLAAAPTYCVCWSLGANNALANGQFPKSMLDVSTGILRDLLAHGITPILFTLPPVVGGDALSWDETDRYNTWVSYTAQRLGFPFLDVHALLVNPATGGYRAGLTDDDLHPNTAGSAIIATAFAEILRRLDVTGPRANLLDVNLLEGGSPGTAPNAHLVGTNGVPTAWNVSVPASAALAAQPNGRPGNQLTLTRSGGADVNAFGTFVTCSPGDLWTFSARVGATVPAAGRWQIGLVDQTAGKFVAVAYGQGMNVADTRILSWRGRVPANTTRLQMFAGAQSADGAVLRLAQMSLRNLSVKNIPL